MADRDKVMEALIKKMTQFYNMQGSGRVSDKDVKMIKKLIRDVVANVLRDIWLKRTTWK